MPMIAIKEITNFAQRPILFSAALQTKKQFLPNLGNSETSTLPAQ